MNLKFGLLGMALVGALITTGIGVAVAKPDHERERVVGIVQAEHGHTLEVRTRSGQILDVHWSEQTRCRVEGAGNDCEAIEPGYSITAVGEHLGDDNFQAKGIAAKPQVHRERDRLVGIVRGEQGQTLQVQARNGDMVNVHWSDETKCRVGEAEQDCEAIEPGYHIAAVGQRLGENAFQARGIAAKPAPTRDATKSERGNRLTGVVQGEHGHTLEVRTRSDGMVNVHWSEQTHCRVAGAGADCEAIEPGYHISAVGERLGNDNFQAEGIGAKPAS